MSTGGDPQVASRLHWWGVTVVLACGFLPPAILAGSIFLKSLLDGELAAPGLTALGYVVVGHPGLVGAACFGTVLLRLLDKPCVWLGFVSAVLVVTYLFLGVIVTLVVVMLVMGVPWLMLAALAMAISVGLAWLILPRGD